MEVEGWLDGVQEMMSRDTAAFAAKENLEEELSRCKVRSMAITVDRLPVVAHRLQNSSSDTFSPQRST